MSNRLSRVKAAFHPAEATPVVNLAEKYFLASGLAAAVVEATPGNHPLHREAAELLKEIDQRGEQLLGQAGNLLNDEKAVEAHDLLQRVAEGFYGRPAGRQAMRMLQEMGNNPSQEAGVVAARDEASAQQALQVAQQAMGEHRLADAERWYRMIGEVYPRAQAAGQARQRLADLRKDRVTATQLAEQRAEPEAPILLSLAGRYAAMGRSEEARRYYQRVLQVAAGTAYAKQAQEGIALLPSAAGSQPVKVDKRSTAEDRG